MEYEVYLRREVFEFLQQCRREQRNQLLTLFGAIARDPFKHGDFTERDPAGRDIEVLVFQRYAVSYWTDHAVKEVKIVEIRNPDR